MAKKKMNDSTIETFTHDGSTRKNIPAAEYQAVMAKEEQVPYRVI